MKELRDDLLPLRKMAESVMPGKSQEVLLAFTGILAQGHVLIEDVPGMGKTTLVSFLARFLGLDLKRVQFTNDLLPADILGVSVFKPETRDFHFRPGAIFAEMVLADELNRAPPKTQSALLQAMEERVVTVEGVNYPLPKIFIVMATQNPRGMFGTFPLPESQLDRFLLKFPMGLPPREAEKELLRGVARRELLESMTAQTHPEQLLKWQKEVQTVKVSEAILDFIMRLLDASRTQSTHRPLSPRAGIDLLRAARARAFMQGRDYLLPEDIKFVFAPVMGHRLPLQELGCREEHRLAMELLNSVEVVA